MSKNSGKGGSSGASMGAREYSPTRLARIKRGRARQEDRWAAKAGPVTVAYLPGMEPPSDAPEASRKPEPQKPGRPVPVMVGRTGVGNVIPPDEDWPPWEKGPGSGCVCRYEHCGCDWPEAHPCETCDCCHSFARQLAATR